MKNKYKKVILPTVLSFSTVVGLVSAPVVRAEEIVPENESNILVIHDDDRNYYSTIETVYANEISSKYIIEEYRKKFDIEFLNSGDVIINNVQYKEDDFFKMAMSQENDLNKNKKIARTLTNEKKEYSILDYLSEYDGVINTIDYKKINDELMLKNKVDHNEHFNSKLRCTACGKYSPSNAPTSGYHAFTTGFVKRGSWDSFTLNLTSVAISTFAHKFCMGKTALAKAALTALIDILGPTFAGKVVQGDYSLRQTWHNVCPRATYEQRKIFTKQGGEDKNKITNIYYYSSNPY